MRFKKGDTVCLNRVKGMPNKSFKIMTATEILNRQKEAKKLAKMLDKKLIKIQNQIWNGILQDLIIKTVIKQDFDEATQRDLDRYLAPRKKRK